MRPEHIYKIFQLSEWDDFQQTAVFKGSPVDLTDGFIHLSCQPQIQGTLDKHYTSGANLVVAEISASALSGALKYEASRGGEDFPHHYADLPLSAVLQSWDLAAGPDGRYDIKAIVS